MVLTTMLDTLFLEWDVYADIRHHLRRPAFLIRSPHGPLKGEEGGDAPLLSTRLQTYGQRQDSSLQAEEALAGTVSPS